MYSRIRAVLTGDERTRQTLSEPIDLRGAVSQTVIVGHIVKEPLSIERSAQQECKIAVRSTYDLGDEIDSVTSIKRILVCQAVLHPVTQWDELPEHLRNAGEQCRVDRGRFPHAGRSL
jgi:hypothetical protein